MKTDTQPTLSHPDSYFARLRASHEELKRAMAELAETSWTDVCDGTEADLKQYRAFVKRTASAALRNAEQVKP